MQRCQEGGFCPEIFDYGNLSNSDSQLLNTNAEIVCKNYLCIEMERFFVLY